MPPSRDEVDEVLALAFAAAAYGERRDRETGSSRPFRPPLCDRPAGLRFEGFRLGWLEADGARLNAEGSKALIGAFAPCFPVAAAYGPSCRMKPVEQDGAVSGGVPQAELPPSELTRPYLLRHTIRKCRVGQ